MDVTSKFLAKSEFDSNNGTIHHGLFIIGDDKIYYDLDVPENQIDLENTDYSAYELVQLPMEQLQLDFKNGGNLTAELSTIQDLIYRVDPTFDPGTVFAVVIGDMGVVGEGPNIPDFQEQPTWTMFWDSLAVENSNDPNNLADFQVLVSDNEDGSPTALGDIFSALGYDTMSTYPTNAGIPFKISGASNYSATVGDVGGYFNNVSDLSSLRFGNDFTLEIDLIKLPTTDNVLDLTGNQGHAGHVIITTSDQPAGATTEGTTLDLRVPVGFTFDLAPSLDGYLDLNVVQVGTAGDDAITGGASHDNIDALDGNDTIDGGYGNDVLDGGNGADTFVFEDGDGHDIIQKFVSEEDKLFITIDGVTETYSLGQGDMTLADWKGDANAGNNTVIRVDEFEGRTLLTYGVDLDNTIDLGVPEVAANVVIAETGERWGDYIMYGVYASSDMTIETMNATLTWWDKDYSLISGSIAEGARAIDETTSEAIFSANGAFAIDSFEGRKVSFDDNDTYDGISFAFNTQNSTETPVSIDIAKGELLVEFMLERDATQSKLDTITLTDLDIDGGYSSNNPFTFDFAYDTFNIDLVTHSSLDARAPNGKIFISDGSVVDGLALTPKAVQTTDAAEWGDNIVEYDINLRVSRPILELENVSMPHEETLGDGYLLEVKGNIDVHSFIDQISADLPAGLATQFYEVDSTLLAMSDVDLDNKVNWAEALDSTAVTPIFARDSDPETQGFYAWGSSVAYPTTVIIELDTAALGNYGGYVATEGTFTIGSFLGASYPAGDGESFAIEYVSGAGAIEEVQWDVVSGKMMPGITGSDTSISIDWQSLSDDVHTTTDTFVINDGYEAVILGDKFYENPIGFKPSVTAQDASLVLDMVASTGPNYTNTQYISADFNQDGKVDVVDAEQILKYSARMVAEDVSSVSEVPQLEFISRPEWFYIDDIEGTNQDASAMNDVKFDDMLDLFVGRTENINATAVLTGDVSAEFINVPDGLNQIYLNDYMTVHDVM